MSTDLHIPDGRVLGCLPRKSRYGDVCRLLSDAIETIPRDEWHKYIGKVVLRPYVRQILDQGSVGSCAAESTTQGVMVTRDFGGQDFVLLNPWSVYRVTSGGSDNGSSIDDNLAHARNVGILPESYWPRSKGWQRRPPRGWEDIAGKYRIHEFYDIGTVAEVGTALIQGFPVVFGWQGHSCVMVELISETEALYPNSWDVSWGDKGFGKIRLDYINFGYGAFAIRTTTVPADEQIQTSATTKRTPKSSPTHMVPAMRNTGISGI